MFLVFLFLFFFRDVLATLLILSLLCVFHINNHWITNDLEWFGLVYFFFFLWFSRPFSKHFPKCNSIQFNSIRPFVKHLLYLFFFFHLILVFRKFVCFSSPFLVDRFYLSSALYLLPYVFVYIVFTKTAMKTISWWHKPLRQ